MTHESPANVQWSCIADGLQAATGVSVWKLNLHYNVVPKSQMRSIVRERKIGRQVILKLKPDFLIHFLNLPEERLPEAGKDVMALNDDEVFVIVATKKK